MSNSNTKNTVPGLDPRFHILNVSVEFDDAQSTAAGVVRVVCGGGVAFTPAGRAALLAQANTYLTSGKHTSIDATAAKATVDLSTTVLAYTCLVADSAAQITALQALITAANVAQVVTTIR